MLRRSSDLYLPDRKELHFFDDEQVDWDRPDYAGYEAWFSGAGAGQICGEATPIYMFLPSCIDRIRAYNPAMKLIAILRDPVSRACSQWRMETTRGFDQESFARAIREGRARFEQNPRVFSYVERGFYAPQIRRMLARFPRAQCHFLLSEDLREDPGAALAGVADFPGCRLNLSPLPKSEIGYFRSDPALAGGPEEEDLACLRDLFRDDIPETGRLIGRDLSHWLG